MSIFKMPEEKISLAHQLQQSGTWGYICMMGLACWGGAVRYINAVLRGQKLNILNLILEMFVSSFCGLMAAFVCVYFNLDIMEGAVFIGMAGYAGTSFLDKLKNATENKIKKP